jgi:DNA-binding LacI/PurR family transcriptional regulator
MGLAAAQRQEFILQELRLHGTVKVTDIAGRFGVSVVSARRDLSELADRGLVHRTHGGATLPRPQAQGTAGGGWDGDPGRANRFVVGMVLPSATYYYPGVIRGAEAAAARLGIRLVLGITLYDAEEDRRQVERLVAAGVDGLLLATSRSPDEDQAAAALVAGVELPLVLVERELTGTDAGPDVEHVRTDHQHGAAMAVAHFARAGHRGVALAVQQDSPTTPWLVRGHAEAVHRLGLRASGVPVHLLTNATTGTNRIEQELSGLLDACTASGTRAVLIHHDLYAVRLAELVQARGLSVPDDLAIITYDDEIAALADVPLTAVAPPKEEVGATAVEFLAQRLADGDGRALRHLRLLPRLNVRASCGAASPVPAGVGRPVGG